MASATTGTGAPPDSYRRRLRRGLSHGWSGLGRWRWWLAVLVAGIAGYVVWFAWALEHADFEMWGTLLIVPALVLVNIPLLRLVARQETDPRVAFLVVVAFFVKLGFAFVNHAVAFRLYGGVADARGYHGGGVRYAEAFRDGNFALAQNEELGRRFIKVVAGAVYTVTGPSRLGGYLIFACIAFWGLYLFYRAFRLAVPDGDARRYCALVLFLPSLLFWTSAIGKEAWMTAALGLCALGAARLLTRRRGGMVILGLGLLASSQVRPHLSVMVVVAVLAAYLVRRSARRTRLGPLASVLGIVVLLVLGSLAASRFASSLGLPSLSASSVGSVLESTAVESEIGRSRIPDTGLGWPVAVAGVLFRPFPFEAHNIASLIASLEGAAMLVLVVASWRRVVAVGRALLRHTYLLFCTAYTLMFLAAFSAFGNFGLLARERVQVFPFVLVLLALVPAPRRARGPGFGLPPWTSHPVAEPVAAPVETGSRG